MESARQFNSINCFNFLSIPLDSGSIDISTVSLIDETCYEFEHSHPEYEIYYCLEGSVNLQCSGVVHCLRPNDFAILTPGVGHHVICEPHLRKRYFICIFHPNPASAKPGLKCEDDFFRFFPLVFKDRTSVFGSDQKNCAEMVARLQELTAAKELSWELEYRGLMLIFLLRLLRNFPLPVSMSTPTLSGESVLAAEIDYHIRNHSSEANISLQTIADQFYTTPRNINRILQKYYSTSYQNLLDANRLGLAKKYLLETDYSVEKISGLVGLSTLQPLFRLFRMHEGMTPNEYRLLHKNSKTI